MRLWVFRFNVPRPSSRVDFARKLLTSTDFVFAIRFFFFFLNWREPIWLCLCEEKIIIIISLIESTQNVVFYSHFACKIDPLFQRKHISFRFNRLRQCLFSAYRISPLNVATVKFTWNSHRTTAQTDKNCCAQFSTTSTPTKTTGLSAEWLEEWQKHEITCNSIFSLAEREQKPKSTELIAHKFPDGRHRQPALPLQCKAKSNCFVRFGLVELMRTNSRDTPHIELCVHIVSAPKRNMWNQTDTLYMSSDTRSDLFCFSLFFVWKWDFSCGNGYNRCSSFAVRLTSLHFPTSFGIPRSLSNFFFISFSWYSHAMRCELPSYRFAHCQLKQQFALNLWQNLFFLLDSMQAAVNQFDAHKTEIKIYEKKVFHVCVQKVECLCICSLSRASNAFNRNANEKTLISCTSTFFSSSN